MESVIIAINNWLTKEDFDNRIFDPARTDGKHVLMNRFRGEVERRGGKVVTLDTVDFHDPAVKHVVYFDYSWKYAKIDPFLDRIPFDKRALVIMEPCNINPSLYYINSYRKRFATIFTWDHNLQRQHPEYVPINVPITEDMDEYRTPRFAAIPFAEKKLVIAINSNRWSYMPQSSYALRIKYYQYFDRAYPEQFDLYGVGWNQPCIFYEKWLGFPHFKTFRRPTNSYTEKPELLSRYRFTLCIENNPSQPGYISEKITDSFCARCVPVYYGWQGINNLIPRDTWIDMRDFKTPATLGAFLAGMAPTTHQRYLEAIDRFIQSDAARFFTPANFFGTIATRLGLTAAEKTTTRLASKQTGTGDTQWERL